VLGELNPDIIVGLIGDPRFGQAEQTVDSFAVTIGGSGAITACAAARLGLDTALVAVVGQDVHGRLMMSELSARGVDISHVQTSSSEPTGATVLLVRPGGDRAILTSMGTIEALTADRVPTQVLIGADHVHLAGWFLQHGLRPGASGLLALARAGGASVSLDPNYDPALGWDAGIGDVLAKVDVLLVNEREATGIAAALGQRFGADGHTDGSDFQGGGVAGSVEFLLEQMTVEDQPGSPAREVVLKRGADGAVCLSKAAGRPVERVTAAVPDREWLTPVTDTVGAGDCLAAAWICARLSGATAGEALRRAVVAGSLSTRSTGGVDGAATAEDIDRVLGPTAAASHA